MEHALLMFCIVASLMLLAIVLFASLPIGDDDLDYDERPRHRPRTSGRAPSA